MTNPPVLTRLPDRRWPDAPTPVPPRGFFDCRGDWQALDDGEDSHDPA